ncbi:MAG: hypothetical protein FWF70_00435, partial [Bacteroidetes bacterium]|nr:hypothetical protein [Bacteroidota bacterium]
LLKLFEKNNVTVLRMGLHPSEGLLTGNDLVAGPFHVSFKELVLSAIWKEIWDDVLMHKTGEELVIEVPPKSINAAVGYQSANKKYLLENFRSVIFQTNDNLTGYEYNIYIKR